MAAKRFRVFDIENQKMVFKSDLLKDCVEFLLPKYDLLNKPFTEGGNPYLDFFVDCTVDDIEVNWIDLLREWHHGERPEDSQMF